LIKLKVKVSAEFNSRHFDSATIAATAFREEVEKDSSAADCKRSGSRGGSSNDIENADCKIQLKLYFSLYLRMVGFDDSRAITFGGE